MNDTKRDEKNCPRCDSPNPKLHPAMNLGGEVQMCAHQYHKPTPTPDASGFDESDVMAEVLRYASNQPESYATKLEAPFIAKLLIHLARYQHTKTAEMYSREINRLTFELEFSRQSHMKRIAELEAENERLKFEHSERTQSLMFSQTINKELEARLGEMRDSIYRALENELCGGTSCPLPMRAMCSNETHKILREALTDKERG